MAEGLVNLQNLAPNLSGPGLLMTKIEVLLTLINNVCLRSWDVYSDVAFAVKLIVPKCYNGNITDSNFEHYAITNSTVEEQCIENGGKFESHINYALTMLCPVLLTTFAMFPHWWKEEKKTSTLNKIFTFVLVIMKAWYQWKMLQALYKDLVLKDSTGKKNKERYISNFGNLGMYQFIQKKYMSLISEEYNIKITEPLLECVPQVHILLCVFLQNPEVVTDGSEFFFLTTFGTSVLSASMGITNFLMQGRCSLVPQKGFLGGKK